MMRFIFGLVRVELSALQKNKDEDENGSEDGDEDRTQEENRSKIEAYSHTVNPNLTRNGEIVHPHVDGV